MKKQIKKLSLNKRTITNLNPAQMSKQLGGSTGCYPISHPYCGNATKNGKTCPGHNTCYTC